MSSGGGSFNWSSGGVSLFSCSRGDVSLFTPRVAKAFLMVSIAEGDRDALRFLWIEDVSNPDTEILLHLSCL